MVGILIITHGSLGEALIGGAAHVLGKPLEQVRALPVSIADDPEALLREARALLRELDRGQGVLVLADICGGTPSNIATRLGVPGKVAAVCGANLPMLVRALTYRDKALAQVVEKALSGGAEGVFQLCGEKANAAG
jgi:PTS system mannose-specific IIA component